MKISEVTIDDVLKYSRDNFNEYINLSFVNLRNLDLVYDDLSEISDENDLDDKNITDEEVESLRSYVKTKLNEHEYNFLCAFFSLLD